MIPIFVVLPQFIGLLLWAGAIRPYCIRNRKGYTTGANAGITFWIDWQDASELAKNRGDRGMRWVCRSFLAMQGVTALAILSLVVV